MNKLIITLICIGSLLLKMVTLDAHWVGNDPTVEDTVDVYDGLFDKEEPLHLTLTSDFRTIRKTRSKGIYVPAEMTCHVTDSLRVTHPVRLKARGIYRKENCSVPPLWLNIRYSGIDNEELSGARRIKMVTRCRSGEQYSDYLLREYLVYKIYNLLTPVSYRVRLIHLKWVDTGRNNRESFGWAFLVEPDEMLASRLQASEIRNDKLSMRSLDPEAMDRLAMFQYMIGNPDYSVTGRHNLRIFDLQEPGSSGLIPVPYDFDFTGFVNAHYATPNERLEIHSVRERYFVGPCRDKQGYEDAIGAMASVRDEIEATIWAFDYLDEENRFDMIGYIESFFNTAGNVRFIDREISSTCR